MKKIMAAVLFAVLAGASARADVNLGLSADEDGLREFHMAVGDFYSVPEKEVVVIRERQVPDEEMPVIFYLAKKAKVAPGAIVDLRLGGKSWMDITYYYGMGADIYYVEAAAPSGPPYGRALGYYKEKPKSQWKYIKLGDDDVVNLVNLKFISGHYGCSPGEVIKMRSDGKKFIDINKDAKDGKIAKKSQSEKKEKAQSKSKKSGSKGKGKKKK